VSAVEVAPSYQLLSAQGSKSLRLRRSFVLIVKETDFEFDPPLPKLTFVLEKVAALEGIELDWNDRFTSPEPCPEALDTVTVYVAVSPLVFSVEDGLTETELTYGKAHAL
jgi:hypothetical protein